MPDDRFEEFVRQASREYNAPPETPREEMWTRIVEERRSRVETNDDVVQSVVPRIVTTRWGWIAAAAAALLLIGIGIGRIAFAPSLPNSNDAPRIAAVPSALEDITESPNTVAYQLEAKSHFKRAEVLLTHFNPERTPPGVTQDELSRWARGLLVDTRLLIDSPAAADPEYRKLLKDLELILAQIALNSGTTSREEKDWISDGLQQRSVMQRLRYLQPTRPGNSGI